MKLAKLDERPPSGPHTTRGASKLRIKQPNRKCHTKALLPQCARTTEPTAHRANAQ